MSFYSSNHLFFEFNIFSIFPFTISGIVFTYNPTYKRFVLSMTV